MEKTLKIADLLLKEIRNRLWVVLIFWMVSVLMYHLTTIASTLNWVMIINGLIFSLITYASIRLIYNFFKKSWDKASDDIIGFEFVFYCLFILAFIGAIWLILQDHSVEWAKTPFTLPYLIIGFSATVGLCGRFAGGMFSIILFSVYGVINPHQWIFALLISIVPALVGWLINRGFYFIFIHEFEFQKRIREEKQKKQE